MSGTTRPYAVYGFVSTHEALAAESVLKSAGVRVVPVPSPKELGDLCGIALRVEPEETDHVERLLAGARLGWKARVEIEDV
jgi:hypothetical protein